ncbi:MAG: hypothetical protein U1E27_04720 [Kiritimatiellia bacterium]|nr:hypothetical protein [Kiritimatiellia bacterium]
MKKNAWLTVLAGVAVIGFSASVYAHNCGGDKKCEADKKSEGACSLNAEKAEGCTVQAEKAGCKAEGKEGCEKKVEKAEGCCLKKDAAPVVGTAQTLCPIMNAPVNQKLFVDYEGKRVYVCCKGCLAAVKKDAAKIIGEMEKKGITLARVPVETKETKE